MNILEHEREALETKIAKMNRRAVKLGLGLPPISASYEPTIIVREIAPGVSRKLAALKVTLTGEAPRINGYTFICRVEHTEAGNIVSGPTGTDRDLSQWYEGGPTCDHCKKSRSRKDTFVLADESGETIRIGRSCLADFVRSPEAIKWAESAMWGNFFPSQLDSEGFGSSEGFAVEPVTVLAYALASIRTDHGFYRKGWDGTRSGVSFAIRPPHPSCDKEQKAEWHERQPTADETVKAEEIAQWAKVQGGSDYLHNVSVAVSMFSATGRTWGILVSVPQAYARATGTQKQSEPKPAKCDVPAELDGQRVKLSGEAISYKWQENDMGDGTLKVLLRFECSAGEWRGWMTASLAEMETERRGAGDRWTMTARVERKAEGFAIISRPTQCAVTYAKPERATVEPVEVPDPFGAFGEPQADPKAA